MSVDFADMEEILKQGAASRCALRRLQPEPQVPHPTSEQPLQPSRRSGSGSTSPPSSEGLMLYAG